MKVEKKELPPTASKPLKVTLVSVPESHDGDCAACLAAEQAIENLGKTHDIRLTKLHPASKETLNQLGITDPKFPTILIEDGPGFRKIEGFKSQKDIEDVLREVQARQERRSYSRPRTTHVPKEPPIPQTDASPSPKPSSTPSQTESAPAVKTPSPSSATSQEQKPTSTDPKPKELDSSIG